MGVSNPVQAMLGILQLMDEVREKVRSTELAALSWRPANPDSAKRLADLVTPALEKCEDQIEALIVVAAAAMRVACEDERGFPK